MYSQQCLAKACCDIRRIGVNVGNGPSLHPLNFGFRGGSSQHVDLISKPMSLGLQVHASQGRTTFNCGRGRRRLGACQCQSSH